MQFSDVSDLPGPPLLERFFLVAPVPTALTALFLGLLLFEILRRKGKERWGMASFVVGAIAGGAILLAGTAVVTPYEETRAATERFVERAVAGDRGAIEAMLAPGFELAPSPGEPSRGADWLLDRVEGAPRLLVSNQQVWRGGEVRSPTSIRTRVTLRTELSLARGPDRFASTWDLSWRQGASGRWALTRLEPVSLAGQKPWRGWSGSVPSASWGD